jgi:hypothetical protein
MSGIALSTAKSQSLNKSLLWRPPTSLAEKMSATYLVGLATLIILATIAVLERVTRVSVDANEPPLLKPRVPVFGHILSFIQRPSEYFIVLR